MILVIVGRRVLDAKGATTESRQGKVHFLAKLAVGEGRLDLAIQRIFIQIETRHSRAKRLWTGIGLAVENEVEVLKDAARPSADSLHCAVNNEPAHVVNRVEAFDCVSGNVGDAGTYQKVGKFIRQLREHFDVSVEQQSIDLLVWIAAIDRPGGHADLVQQGTGRRDSRGTVATRSLCDATVDRPELLHPAKHPQLVTRMRHDEGGCMEPHRLCFSNRHHQAVRLGFFGLYYALSLHSGTSAPTSCTQFQESAKGDRSAVPDLLKTPERCERTFRRVGRRPAPDRGDITFRPGRGTDRPGERLHHGIERFAQSTEVVSPFGHEYHAASAKLRRHSPQFHRHGGKHVGRQAHVGQRIAFVCVEAGGDQDQVRLELPQDR